MPKGIKYRRAYQRMAAYLHVREPTRAVAVRLTPKELAQAKQLAHQKTQENLSRLIRHALQKLFREEGM